VTLADRLIWSSGWARFHHLYAASYSAFFNALARSASLSGPMCRGTRWAASFSMVRSAHAASWGSVGPPLCLRSSHGGLGRPGRPVVVLM
jgi:hypothetical protein